MGDTAPLIRIGLRYLAGYLVFKSIIPKDMAAMLADDPELVGFIGACIAVVVETAYGLAKRFGWAR